MNKEMKVALFLLACLVGLIIFVEVKKSGTKGDLPPDVPVSDLGPATGVANPGASPTGEAAPGLPPTAPVVPGSAVTVATTAAGSESPAPLFPDQGGAGHNANVGGAPTGQPTQVASHGHEPAGAWAPEATTAPPSEPQGIPATYAVQKGDTLSGISKKVLGSTRFQNLIRDKNPEVEPNMIYPGIKLAMPSAAELEAFKSSHPTAAGEPATANSRAHEAAKVRSHATKTTAHGGSRATGDQGTYNVRPKDTIYTIARRELGDASQAKELLRLNPGIDPNRLKIGSSLVLPTSGATPVSP